MEETIKYKPLVYSFATVASIVQNRALMNPMCM